MISLVVALELTKYILISQDQLQIYKNLIPVGYGNVLRLSLHFPFPFLGLYYLLQITSTNVKHQNNALL